MSEQGVENAEIEANCGETQVVGRQGDKSQAADSGDEKRSQLRDQDSWPRMEHGGNTDHTGNQQEGFGSNPQPTREANAVLELCLDRVV